MATVSIREATYTGNSTIEVAGTVHNMPIGSVRVYISIRNENSTYKNFTSMYTTVTNPTNLEGINREFRVTSVQSGFLSNNTTWYVSFKCDSSISSEMSVLMPFEGSIPSDFVISERPTQQTQNVVYNGVSKGEAGTCVANTFASAKHIQELRNGKDVLDYSVMWFYGMAGDGSTEELNYEKSLRLLRDRGMPPYQSVTNTIGVTGYPDIAFQKDSRAVYNVNNTTDVNNFALPQKIASWESVTITDVGFYNNVISAIKNKAVMMTMMIDKSMDDAQTTGLVGGVTGNTRGGHAVIVIGIKTINGKKYWVVQNSWTYISGVPMGDKGLYYIPFSWFSFGVTGITGFYILNDDHNAPPLPALPDKLDAPMIATRGINTLRLYTNQNMLATNYQLAYRKQGTTTYTYTTNHTIDGGKVYFDVSGLTSGTTYEFLARMYKDGKWSGWSSMSLGTTSPCKGIVDRHVCYNTTSISIRTKLDSTYDNGGYTGVIYRLYNDGGYVKDIKGDIGSDCIISGLTNGVNYSIEPLVYYRYNSSDITTACVTFYFTFEYVAKPSKFSWTNKKSKGEDFNLLASEWNDFSTFITKVCKYNLVSQTSMKSVEIGDKCMGGTESKGGNMWNQPLNANSLMKIKYGESNYFIYPQKGNDIKAVWLNDMVNELNTMIA